ncbi:nitrate- and nitrite sensing domain-containing protein [Pseudofrankia sp. DC12]|uniref:sensor histidine kinase n=1 Tax=Pseudofrankia sp. DC12 TaxID=683315 RepID=UPI000695EEF7|nr:nitrate- and nitrite sensing domain-containing protein [Pseudofrankia sp. DC12]
MERWPVRYRLAAALVVPLLAVAGLSAALVVGQLQAAHAAGRTRTAAQLTIKVNVLVRALAQERYATSSFVASGYVVMQADTAAARGPVDEAYRQVTAAASGAPDDARLHASLAAAQQQMSQLPGLRSQVDARTATISPVSDGYDNIVGAWLGVSSAQIGLGTASSQLVRTATALAAISAVTEQTAQQRGYVSLTVFLHDRVADNVGRIRTATGAEAAWLAEFDAAASDDQRRLYDQRVGPTIDPVNALRDQVLAAAAAGRPIDVQPAVWLGNVNSKIDQLRAVEAQINLSLADQSSSLVSAARGRAALVGGAAAAVMLLAIVVSVVIARRLVRQLRALRADAVTVAEQRLPSVTAAIRDRRPVDPAGLAGDPDERAGLVPEDEIGDVSRALRSVYAAAVLAATEVAAQNSLSSSMQSLARRSQTLIHRQLKLITVLERDQQDPDMLERLFRLDHLATRMRREVEGQIALSGGQPSRVFRQPVKLIDTMRAAVAEVEAYTRVEASATVDAWIAGPVVGDVIHLLAELIENACQMSPEQTPVVVTGNPVGAGIAVEVSDRGIGIEPAALAGLNQRLADPPPFHPESEAEKLGLWVVANLARRHGIDVSLARSAYGGVSAVVVLPASVLAEADAPVLAGPPDDEPLRAALARMGAFDRLDVVGSGYDETPAPAAAAAGSPADPRADLGGHDDLDSEVDFAGYGHDARYTHDSDYGHDAGYDYGHDAGYDYGHDAGYDYGHDAGFGGAGGHGDDGGCGHDGGHGGAGGAGGAGGDGLGRRRATGPLVPAAVRDSFFLPPPVRHPDRDDARATGPAPDTHSWQPGRPGLPARAVASPRPERPAAWSAAPVPEPDDWPEDEPRIGHLPRRSRGESLNAELRGGRYATSGVAGGGPRAGGPDPEKARRLVTAFRAGFQQGLPARSPRDDERIGDATHR